MNLQYKKIERVFYGIQPATTAPAIKFSTKCKMLPNATPVAKGIPLYSYVLEPAILIVRYFKSHAMTVSYTHLTLPTN